MRHRIVSRELDPIHCGEGVEIHGVSLQLPFSNLHIYNVYCHSHADLDVGELLASASTANTYIGGDFNAHHPLLHSPSPNNAAGRHVTQVMSETQCVALLN